MLRNRVLKNFIWRLAERCGAQLVQVVVSIVLARLLEPTDYGLVALMNVFISILGIFVNCGLGSALVQKKDADDLDFSSVFHFQMACCILLYLALFFAAPWIAQFYQKPEMTSMIRVLGVTLIIAGIKSIQTSYVSRTMQFKRFFFATLGGTVGAAVLGIRMAVLGYGAWALIGQSLFNNTVDTIILWATVKWRPKKMFSFERLKGLLGYGWKLLVSALIDTVYNNLRSLIIGKVYSSEDLAYYNRGKSWPSLIVENINSSIDSVLLPTMSVEQDDPIRVKAMTRRAIKTSTYIMAPMMIGLAVIGKTLVKVLLTDKWLPCLPFQTIFCITYIFYPIHTANLNAIKALGRSDIFLKLEIAKKVVGLTALAVTVPISVMAMGYSLFFTSIASQIINSWPNRKLLNYGYIEQIMDILPGIAMAIVMGIIIYPIKWLVIPDILILVLQVVIGAVVYIMGSVFLRLESFLYLLEVIKPKRRTS